MELAGAILLAVVTVQLGLALLSLAQKITGPRARSSGPHRPQTATTEALRIEHQQKELHWSGYRKFTVYVKIGEVDGVCSLYLVPHDEKPLPLFPPGQYLTFRLAVPGQARPVVRCYSISSPPDYTAPERAARFLAGGPPPPAEQNFYRITVKRAAAPRDRRGATPGLASHYFHDQVQEGDVLDVQAPRGQFVLDMQSMAPVVLIAAGVGITPITSMTGAVALAQPDREVWLFYGVRNRGEHMLRPYLDELASRNENLRVRYCYSQPAKDDVAGRDYHFAERISVELLQRVLPSHNYEFYVCGPPAMMDSVISGLKTWGVPDESIFLEAFGPATVKAAPRLPVGVTQAAEGPRTPVQVTFSRSGKVFPWDPEAGNLLDFAEDHGLVMESGCRAGNCGTCLVAVKSGRAICTIEHGAESSEGTCLTCISVPEEDLVLDA